MVVHGGVGGAAHRARERERADAVPLAAQQQLGGGGEEGTVAAADAEDEARGEALAEHPKERGGVVLARRVDVHLAGEHDLLELPRADQLDGAGDSGLVVLGRHRARDPVAPGGRGVEQRQRRRAQFAHAVLQAGEQLLGGVVGGGERVERQAHVPSAAAPRGMGFAGERYLGHDQGGRLEARPRGVRAALRGEGEATDRDRSTATEVLGGVADGGGRQGAPAISHGGKAFGASRSEQGTSPSAASARAPRSGCSKRNHGSPGRREAQATALGSTPTDSETLAPLHPRSASSGRVSAASVG